MQFTASAFAVLGLATLASTHMVITSPVPYGKSSLNNSPLDAAGADFPCKQRSGVYDTEGASNVMALGSSQTLAFMGSAVHGGGSCQISITYDATPSASSTFKVIHSIIGGCPATAQTGNFPADSASFVDPDTYSYTIPTSLPTGNATIAWTWFNKIGNREMYMNCAPVTLTASSSKREVEERDLAAFNALPDMFTANIGNGCGTKDSTDLVFPNPGDSVVSMGGSTASAAAAAPTGTCASGSSSSGSGTPAVASSVVTAAPVATTSAAAVPGGVFATSAAAPAASPATSSAAAVAPAPVATNSPVASSTPATTGSVGALSGVCTPEGEWNCIAGTSYQQCASGSWSVVQPLAAGTTCTAGQSAAINIEAIVSKPKKRASQFANPHIRRHARHVS